MGTCITVGGLPYPDLSGVGNYVHACLHALQRPQQRALPSLFARDPLAAEADILVQHWKASDSDSLVIDTLNEASIVLFLEHAAKLEGLSNSTEAIDESKWRYLPYWQGSVWLPLATSRPPVVVNNGDWPIFIGTCAGLLDDLNEIAKKSDMRLGERPEHFDLMLNDPKRFYGVEWDAFGVETTIRWIWLAYATGAERAVAENKPLWQ